jgi:hypothetical protein
MYARHMRSSRYEPSARAFKHNRCELSCPERQGVDADPVVKIFGSVRRSVAMNDNGTEIAWMAEEAIAYPNQVVLRLGAQCDTRSHAGMSKKVAARVEAALQAPVEKQVILRKQSAKGRIRRHQPVAPREKCALDNAMLNTVRQQRFIASVVKPIYASGRFVKEGQKHGLVVSRQAEPRKTRRQAANQTAYHALGIAAAIDIVAKKNQLRASRATRFAVALDEVEKPVQKVEPAMNVPHGVNADALRHTGVRPRAGFDNHYGLFCKGVFA